LDLEKLRASGAAQSARDALSDLYVEPAHPRRIPRVGLDEWRTALGVTAPNQDLRRVLSCREAERECGDHAERATAYSQRIASVSPIKSAGPSGEPI